MAMLLPPLIGTRSVADAPVLAVFRPASAPIRTPKWRAVDSFGPAEPTRARLRPPKHAPQTRRPRATTAACTPTSHHVQGESIRIHPLHGTKPRPWCFCLPGPSSLLLLLHGSSCSQSSNSISTSSSVVIRLQLAIFCSPASLAPTPY